MIDRGDFGDDDDAYCAGDVQLADMDFDELQALDRLGQRIKIINTIQTDGDRLVAARQLWDEVYA